MGQRIVFYSTKKYDQESFIRANTKPKFELIFIENHLNTQSAKLTQAGDLVCVFVNDKCGHKELSVLKAQGVRGLLLRSAGFNHVDLKTCKKLNLPVARVPSYSPHAVAEHTLMLMLALNRKIHRASNRMREGNFQIDGLLGFDMNKKTVGIIGTGQIGAVLAKILLAMNCRVLAYDLSPNEKLKKLGVEYVTLPKLFSTSHIISLHCPLTPKTKHIIGPRNIKLMQPGVMIINTGRGGLIDTVSVIAALKNGKIGYLGLDVYEEEEQIFSEDFSGKIIQDDVFSRLLTFPNVLLTAHQAFFTEEAVNEIARVTIENASLIFTNKTSLAFL